MLRNERRNSILMTRHYKDLGSAFDSLRSKRGGGGMGGKKEKKEGGKKERGLEKEGKERLLW